MPQEPRSVAEVSADPELYARLAGQLPDGIVVADADRQIVLASDRAVQLTGIPLTARVGDDIRVALPLFAAGGVNWWDANDPWQGLCTRSGTPESRVTTAAGHTVLLTTRHVRHRDHSLRLLVMSMRDTRARDRIESEMSALITTAAHELRSPLTSVRGFSRTLRSRWGQLTDDQKQWMLAAIESDSERLSRLVSELLDISRLDTGRLVLSRSAVDLAALVTERIDRLVRRGHPADRFGVVDECSDMTLWADGDRLAQVADNLLENALHHGAGRIRARLHREGRWVHLDVSDEGPGIDKEARSLVFSRFWQGDRRRKTGTGLGLYVVRGLVEAHDGTVEVLDCERGATLRVSLPAGLPDHLR